MVFSQKPLLVEQQLRGERETIFEDSELEPCQINLDAGLEFGKWLAKEVFVDEERHLAATKMELDEISVMWITIENRPALDENPKCGWQPIQQGAVDDKVLLDRVTASEGERAGLLPQSRLIPQRHQKLETGPLGLRIATEESRQILLQLAIEKPLRDPVLESRYRQVDA